MDSSFNVLVETVDSSTRRHVVKTGDTVEGRYRIIKTLDEGGMGTIYLAEHILIKRRVAIKILRPELAADAEVLERFMNEARAAGSLGHPNIVESTDMGFTREEVPYIVFEYLEGTLLTDEIYRVGGLPVRRALRIGEQIASALFAAHNAGVVHRDLKSENVFLTDRDDALDHVKVLDFGISRFLEIEESSRPGMVMGTPEFMAPEQILHPETVDKRTDIYALGVILYEMLAARRPFRAEHDPHAVLHQVVHDAPPLLNRPDLPPGLSEMIFDKLLAKDPVRRYQSMRDAQGALEAFSSVLRPSSSGSIPPLNKPMSGPYPVQSFPNGTPDPRSSGSIQLQVPTRAVALPPAPRPKRTSIGWLIAAIVAGGAGGALMYLESKTPAKADTTTAAALQADAEKIGSALEDAVHAAHLRAEGVASTPMLRAAIETDAATLKDMAGADFLFTPNKGEILEIFQIGGENQTASLLRIPDGSPAIKPLTGNAARFESDGTLLTLVVSAPIAKQHGGTGGSLVLSSQVDLTPIKQRVSEHVLQATINGLGKPLVLVKDDKSVGTVVTVPITVSKDLKLDGISLATVIAAPATVSGSTYQIARYASWGLGGLLLLIYVGSLLRGRSQG